MGDPLAGAGDCSRRHQEGGCCDTKRWSDVRGEASRDPHAESRAADGRKAPSRSRVTFRTLAHEWQATCCRCTSTRRRRIIGTSWRSTCCRDSASRPLCGRHDAGDSGVRGASDARQDMRRRRSITSTTCLSAVLRTAVKWGHLQDNPARGVDLPTLKTVRPKWALTIAQAAALLDARCRRWRGRWSGLALLTGLRRGELFALRWKDIDEPIGSLPVQRGRLRGRVRHAEDGGRCATHSVVGRRAGVAHGLAEHASKRTSRMRWCSRRGRASRSRPNNVLRRWVFPACEASGFRRATWLTFRRTYSSWAHDKGVPGKVVAQLMGHAKVDTTLNVYTQVIDGALRAAVDRVGSRIVHNCSRIRKRARS